MKKLSRFEIVILIVIISFLFGFIICFLYFYGSNDLFRFPFNSSTWGTAADWIIILATILTARYLIMTFREQKRTNDIQHQVQLNNLFPKFSIEQRGIDMSGDIHKSDVQYYLNLKLIRNDAREFKIENLHENIRVSIFDSPFIKESEVVSFELSNKITSGIDSQIKEIFTFHFDDVDGNKYTQKALIQNNKVYLGKAQKQLVSAKSSLAT